MNGKEKKKINIPYYFTKEDDELMFFAAIHQNNQFCIITREATEKISANSSSRTFDFKSKSN